MDLSSLLAVGTGPTLVTGLDPTTMITDIATIAVPAVIAIAGVTLSISWFSSIIRKFAGAGRRV